MPIRGVFMETSSMPASPDLSLRISPPRTSSPSSTPDTDHDLGLDLLQRIEALKPQADTCSNFACTDLTLSSPSATSDQADRRRPWRWHNGHLISEMVSDGPRPIKGIPIYNSSTSPFLSSADPKNIMGFNHQMSSVPSLWSSFGSSLPCSPSSSSSSGCYSSNLDTTTSFLGLLPSMGSSHHPMMAPVPTRFTGLSSDTGKYYHHHQYGIGPLDVSRNMMMRSRFMQKLPAKRSVRAPRMRWTSTLHARFVHAVELLGGHESMLAILISIAISSCYIFLFVIIAYYVIYHAFVKLIW